MRAGPGDLVCWGNARLESQLSCIYGFSILHLLASSYRCVRVIGVVCNMPQA